MASSKLNLESLGLRTRSRGKTKKPAEAVADAENEKKSDVVKGWDGGAAAEEGDMVDWQD